MGETCTGQCTYRSKIDQFHRVNTHLICHMTCLVSTLTHSLNTVPFITRVSRVLVLAQGVSQIAPNCLFNSRHFCTYIAHTLHVLLEHCLELRYTKYRTIIYHAYQRKILTYMYLPFLDGIQGLRSVVIYGAL